MLSAERIIDCDARVLFVAAAGPRRGYGHLVRCISFARALAKIEPIAENPLDALAAKLKDRLPQLFNSE